MLYDTPMDHTTCYRSYHQLALSLPPSRMDTPWPSKTTEFSPIVFSVCFVCSPVFFLQLFKSGASISLWIQKSGNTLAGMAFTFHDGPLVCQKMIHILFLLRERESGLLEPGCMEQNIDNVNI